MAYKSKLDYMREKLDEGATKKGVVTVERFEKKWWQILAASQVMHSEESDDVQRYEAERTLWQYYWGNSFSGKSPEQDRYIQQPSTEPAARRSQLPRLPASERTKLTSLRQDNPFASESQTMMLSIKEKFSEIQHLRSYEPMMGWNAQTGEPWLALRTVNVRMIIQYGKRLIPQLEDRIFRTKSILITIYYLKFTHYVLFWPEFTLPEKMNDPAAWKTMREVWTFLFTWANSDGKVPQIDVAFNAWMLLPNQECLLMDFPVDFPLKWVESTYSSNDQASQYNQPQQPQYTVPQPGPLYPFSQQGSQFAPYIQAPQDYEHQYQAPQERQQSHDQTAQYQSQQHHHFQAVHAHQSFQQPQCPQYSEQLGNNYHNASLGPRYNHTHTVSQLGHSGQVRSNFSDINAHGARIQDFFLPQLPHAFSNQPDSRVVGQPAQGIGSGTVGVTFGNTSVHQQPSQALRAGDPYLDGPTNYNPNPQAPSQYSAQYPPPPPPGKPPAKRRKNSRSYRHT